MLRNYNTLTVLSDKIKNLKLNNLPNNIILNNNDKYTLVLHTNKLSLTYRLYTHNLNNIELVLPVNKNLSSYSAFLVNWDSTHVLSNFDITSTFYGISSVNYLLYSHNYQLSKKSKEKQYETVTVTIQGDFRGFDTSLYSDKNYFAYPNNISAIQTGISANTYKYYLESINTWGDVPFDSLNYAFTNAYELLKIPNEQLPNVNECKSTFENCANLVNCFQQNNNQIKQFNFAPNFVNCTDMFKNTKISYDFSTLLVPKYLTSISGMFAKTFITKINSQFFKQFNLYGITDPKFLSDLSANYYSVIPQTASGSIETYITKIKEIIIEK